MPSLPAAIFCSNPPFNNVSNRRGDDTVQTMSESVYFCSSSRRITVLQGVGRDAGWFLLVSCTERVSTAVSSCFQARLTEIAQLWNSLKPPFVAFRYSEDLYRREMTGRVMLQVPGGGQWAGRQWDRRWRFSRGMNLATRLHLVAESMNGWSDISALSSASKIFNNFDPTSVGIGFVVGEVALGWISLRDFFFFVL